MKVTIALAVWVGFAACAAAPSTPEDIDATRAADPADASGGAMGSGSDSDPADHSAVVDAARPKDASPRDTAKLDTRGRDVDPASTENHDDLLTYQDGAGTLKAVASAADWQKRRAHILANIQLVTGPLPDATRRVPPDLKVTETVALGTVTREKVSFAVEGGDRVSAYLFIPTVVGKTPAILALHYATHPITIGKRAAAGIEPEASLGPIPYGLDLAERGYVTLVPDYPNFGESVVDVPKLGYASATMKAIWNHMRAVDVLEALPEVDPQRIGALGMGLGGNAAMFAAVFDARIKAVVSASGFTSFPKYRGGDLSIYWCNEYYMPRICSVYGHDPKRMPFDFTEVVGALAPRPFLANAPVKDEYLEVSGVRDCMAASAPVYDLLGAGARLVARYPDGYYGFDTDSRQAAYTFLDASLGRK